MQIRASFQFADLRLKIAYHFISRQTIEMAKVRFFWDDILCTKCFLLPETLSTSLSMVTYSPNKFSMANSVLLTTCYSLHWRQILLANPAPPCLWLHRVQTNSQWQRANLQLIDRDRWQVINKIHISKKLSCASISIIYNLNFSKLIQIEPLEQNSSTENEDLMDLCFFRNNAIAANPRIGNKSIWWNYGQWN